MYPLREGNCCAVCGAAAGAHGLALKRCSGCGQLWLCSKECQKRSWNKLGHKHECAGMREQAAAAKAAEQGGK